MNRVIVGCGAMLLACSLAGCSGPGTSPRDSWTHKELIGHLNSRGIDVVTVEKHSGDAIKRPRIQVVLHYNGKTDIVDITLHASDRAAADAAGTAAGVAGTDGMSWGRFEFVGAPEPLKAIRAALP